MTDDSAGETREHKKEEEIVSSGTDLDLHVTTGTSYNAVSLLGAGHGSAEAIRGPHQLLVTATFVGQLEHLLQWPVT